MSNPYAIVMYMHNYVDFVIILKRGQKGSHSLVLNITKLHWKEHAQVNFQIGRRFFNIPQFELEIFPYHFYVFMPLICACLEI